MYCCHKEFEFDMNIPDLSLQITITINTKHIKHEIYNYTKSKNMTFLHLPPYPSLIYKKSFLLSMFADA